MEKLERRRRDDLEKARANDPNMTILNLEGVGMYKLTLDDMPRVLSALEGNTHVTSLLLGWNNFGPTGLPLIFDAIRELSVTTLNLQSCSLMGGGACLLAKELATNTKITNMDLYDNAIGAIGMRALAAALKINTTLEELNLQSNRIEEGVVELADALAVNSSLKTLGLMGVDIDEAGLTQIALALESNTTLKKIRMSHTVTGLGANAILHMLACNCTLIDFSLDWSHVDATVSAEIKRMLADPVRAAWASGEADTKPACEIPLEHRD
eukprot:m.135158 g.135158  ORF g.135158 m.135158 type:complete len:268 (-) comp14864_c2_seq4:160-963(-)